MPSLPHNFGAPSISRELANIVIDGRYGFMLSRDRETRLLRVAEIASLYTRQELLHENGFGPAAVARVQRWLARHGRRFRDKREPIEAAICRLDIGSRRIGRQQRRNAEPLLRSTRQSLSHHAESQI